MITPVPEQHVEFECPECLRIGLNCAGQYADCGVDPTQGFLCGGCGCVAPLTDCGFELR